MPRTPRLIDRADLRDRMRVFRDRSHAGEVLAKMLETYRDSDTQVMAIPAGGVPVAAVIGERLGLAVDVIVVSKITFAWNSEAGYGALAGDGTLRLNDALITQSALDPAQVAADVKRTRSKVEQRVARLRAERPAPEIAGRSLIVVDDGLASGFTMRVAVEALSAQGAVSLTIAVPTAHREAVANFAPSVEAVYCPNVRGGWSFAVADAYERWSDVTEEEAVELVRNQTLHEQVK